MRIWSLILVLLVACASPGDKIQVPVLEADFYYEALGRIDDQLDDDGSNLKLVEQKLYYCERLDWPETCLDAIEKMKRQKGITPQLLDQYVTYYSKYERHEDLLAVIDQWAKAFSYDRKYLKTKILALSKLQRKNEASTLLRNYMIGKSSREDMAFAANQYLLLKDTLFATYYLGKLYKMDTYHPLVLDHYGNLLLDVGYPDLAFTIFELYAELHPEDFIFHRQLSNTYREYGKLKMARQAMRNFLDRDSIVYLVSDLFVEERKWDSAHFYVDQIIERDSLNRTAWWKKAKLYEDRGWLIAALNYYDHLTYLDENDSLAFRQAAIVRRKIAYLQRLKFEESKIPVPVIEPKKLKPNE